MNDNRRSKRRKADANLLVIDVMTGQNIGRIGNLSPIGMMLICEQRTRDNALYQVSFQLPDARGVAVPIEVGINELWTAPANVSGKLWSGFCIIDIAPQDRNVISDWLENDQNN